MAECVPPNPTSYHFATHVVLWWSVLVIYSHTLTIVRKKLNIMTIVSKIPGLRQKKVKQNLFSVK